MKPFAARDPISSPFPMDGVLGVLGLCLTFVGGVVFLYGGLGAAERDPGTGTWIMLALGSFCLFRALWSGWRPAERDVFIAALTGFVVVFLSPLSHRLFFFLSGSEFRSSGPYFLLVGLGLVRWLRGDPDRRAPWLLLAAQVALTAAFFDYTRGGLLTRDDHPSFLYRFYLAREMFPRFVFYNPEWNGGYLATEFVATGAMSPFLLALPFAYLGRIERLYAWGVPYFFVGLLPWLFFVALRSLRVSRAGAALGGLLALCPTTVVFLYSLLYGVYPFVISCTFAVVAVALFIRIFLDGEARLVSVLALVGATSVCLFWPLGALILLPIIPAFLVVAPRLDAKGWAWAVVVVTLLVGVNLPWIHALASFGDSARFVVEQRSQIMTSGIQWAGAARALWRVIEQVHPLSLVLAPAGILIAAKRSGASRGRWLLLAALIVWNLLVAVLGVQVKEQMALERFSVSFALFAAAGATLALGRLVDGPRERWRTAVGALVLAVLFMGTLNAAHYYQNRGRYRFRLLPADIERTLAVVRESCPSNRRVLVPGFSLHWFGGGHIAALPFLTGRSFVGNDLYHRRDYSDAVPRKYRRGEAFGEFLDLYNVGCVLTWSEPWADRVVRYPQASLVHDEGWLKLFFIAGESNYFLRGHGRVTERLGGLVVETVDDDVVIKYRFTPGLRAIPPVPIEPFPVYGNVNFIRIRPGGGRRVEIVHG